MYVCLQGKDLLFAIALQCVDPTIAAQASDLIIQIHTSLTEDLLDTSVSLHNWFIADTVKRIRGARARLDASNSSQDEVSCKTEYCA